MKIKSPIYSPRNLVVMLTFISLLVNFLGAEAFSHPDSCAITGSALNVLSNNYDPGWYMYPAGPLIYLNSVLYNLIFHILKLSGDLKSFSDFYMMFNSNLLQCGAYGITFTWPARIITALFSVLGVISVFYTTKIATSSCKTAFVAGTLLAISPLWATNSRFATVDIPMSSMVIFTSTFALWMIEKSKFSKWNLITLVALCSLTLSMKYNAALLCASVFLAFVPIYKGRKKEYFKVFIPAGIGVIFLFFIFNPYLLLNFHTAINHFSTQLRHADAGHFGATTTPTCLFYLLVAMRYGFGVPGLICAVVGFVYILATKRIISSKLILLLFPVVFFIFMSSATLNAQRYILPLLPFLAVFAAVGIRYLCLSAQKLPVNSTFISYSLVALCLIPGTQVAFHQNIVSNHEDTRNQLRRSLKKLVRTRGLKVYSGYYIYSSLVYQAVPIREVVSGLPSDLSKSKLDAIIFDSFSHDRYLNPEVNVSNSDLRGANGKEGDVGGKLNPPFKGLDAYNVFCFSPFVNKKENVPFCSKSIFYPYPPDLYYRNRPGPYIEVYIKSKALTLSFAKACEAANVRIECHPATEGYFLNKFNQRFEKK